MNPYFLLFSLYAFLITPLKVHVSVRVGTGVRYRVRLQAAGFPFIRKTQEEEPQEEQPVSEEDVVKTMGGWQPFLRLVREGEAQKVLRSIHLETLYLHAHFSFSDAALTALCYASVRTVLETLFTCGLHPRALAGRVEADFDGHGTELFARGIISARLGSLGLAAIRFWLRLERTKHARSEENAYAAASH